MSARLQQLATDIAVRFGGAVSVSTSRTGEVTAIVPHDRLIEVATVLRDDPAFRFEELVDLCGVDYLGYGQDEWATDSATSTGFSRGAERGTAKTNTAPSRFAVVCHLLSMSGNQRLRLRAYCPDDSMPIMPTLTTVWPSADWFEREAFDLFGILFEGHGDLRRLLTDYGFIGHPFRKDFPLSGNVEVRYDPAKQRVIYQPVTIEPRVLVPRVIRKDHRYDEGMGS